MTLKIMLVAWNIIIAWQSDDLHLYVDHNERSSDLSRYDERYQDMFIQ